jgi:hypothetical protein
LEIFGKAEVLVHDGLGFGWGCGLPVLLILIDQAEVFHGVLQIEGEVYGIVM